MRSTIQKKDGWTTEVLNEAAGKVLKDLGKLMQQPESISADRLAKLTTIDVSCTNLMPENLVEEYQTAQITVKRANADSAGSDNSAMTHRGRDELSKALRHFIAPLRNAKDVMSKFKVFRIATAEGGFHTRVFVSFAGRISGGMIEQNATWSIIWKNERQQQPPKIAEIRILEFEQVANQNRHGAMFSDCTHSIIAKNKCYDQQFIYGIYHWLGRLQDTRYFFLLGNPGVAVGDVNGDGLDDVYITQEEGLPNRLLMQIPNGTAKDVSRQWGVDWLHNSRGALLIDLDNDSDADLVVAMVGRIVVAENDGRRFTIRRLLAVDEDTMSLCSSDYDNDGDLDFYVCVYSPNATLESGPRGEFLAGATGSDNEAIGGRNALFRNDSGWKFTDVTKEAGLDAKNKRNSFAATWEDFDNDGDQDRDPKYLQARMNCGVVLMQLGRNADASQQFAAVLNLDPNYSPARRALQQLPKFP